MSSGRATQRPSIQRCYKPDEASCAHALRLLLKKKGAHPSALGDPKGVHNARVKNIISKLSSKNTDATYRRRNHVAKANEPSIRLQRGPLI
jgi:hypothetical protein